MKNNLFLKIIENVDIYNGFSLIKDSNIFLREIMKYIDPILPLIMKKI